QDPSVAEIFQKIQTHLQENAEKVAGVTGTFHFALSGDDGGDYYVSMDNGQAQVGTGVPQQANCTVTMSADDFKALIGRRLNPMTALATGKLKVSGDLSLALRLQSILG